MRTRVMTIVVISLLFVLPVTAQAWASTTLNLSPEARAKLSTSLINVIDKFETREIDVTVVCDNKNTPGYLQRALDRTPRMNLVEDLDGLGAFHARVSVKELARLAELPFVERVDENTPIQICMDTAKEHAGVDWFRNEYPSLDGNLDGDLNSYSKDDIVIAVLDTGIDSGHDDLDGGKVIGWKDFVTSKTFAHDYHGHGTHCASIAAGTGEGHSGYRGVAPGAALVGLKVLNSQGGGYQSTVETAFNWIINNKDTYGIDIVSLSIGWDVDGAYNSLAILADRLVTDYDLVVCAAAGNTGNTDDDLVMTPGTAKHVITVGNAIDPYQNEVWTGEFEWGRAEDSCYGPVDNPDRIKPDIYAPGSYIWAAEAGTDDEYEPYSGTSMATPFVAGLCALWLDRKPSLRYPAVPGADQKIKELLMGSATDFPNDPDPGLDNTYGAGFVLAQDQDYFFTTDVSNYAYEAPLALGYSWYDQTKTYTDEPLWNGEIQWVDWYKVNAYAGFFIYIQAWGDPDLVLVISIYNSANPRTRVKLAESYPGNDRILGYTAPTSKAYYIKMIVYWIPGTTEFSGDYYDISITTTAS